LSNQKNQLSEALQQHEQILAEAKKITAKEERKERAKDNGNVSGRGQRVVNETKEEVILEFENTKKLDESNDAANEIINEMKVLAGL
jgi:hypothetical protein